MCGIGGWVDWQRDLTAETGVLDAMEATLVQRGPDQAGRYVTPHVAFLHRRLAVVDLVGGKQPMVAETPTGAVVITYNGELYNLPELWRLLQAKGYTFRTRSDTEVVLLSYLAFGEDAPCYLNGIFAFAIWDGRYERLFASRDRLGVKPFFFAERGQGLIFGSELKTLLAHPLVAAEIDEEGLAEVLALAPSRTPGHGVFRNVRELRAGHSLRFDRAGVTVWPYWRLESRPHADDRVTTVATVRELLADAVWRQLISDVPIGVLLSGGLDSSAVAAFAGRALAADGRPLVTYSVDFRENHRFFRPNDFQTNPDAPWVRRMVAELGSQHRFVEFDTPDLVEALPWSLRARDLPGMADVDTSLLLFSREIKKEMTVMLSGEAADEVFGGYPWCHRPDALAADTFPWARRMEERLSFLTEEAIRYAHPRQYVTRRYEEALAEVPRLPGEDGRARRIREILYLNLTRFLPTLLDRKDRMSMAVGLEIRVPFCDHRLVEYVWNIPWEMKALDGVPKGILRHALRGILPDDVLHRPKSPYPSTHNPAYLEACRDWALECLRDPASPLRTIIRLDRVEALAFDEHLLSHDLPWFGQIMGRAQFFAYLVQLDYWFRAYRVVIR